MTTPVRQILTATVLTTTATPAQLFIDTESIQGAYRIWVTAVETTSGSHADYAQYHRSAMRKVTFEANVLINDTTLGDFESGGASAWNCVVQDDGSGNLEIEVTGAASVDITWKAFVEKFDSAA